ncbi:MAG: hypothetical protein Q9168_007121 [Polycauliona sp. 1 TL-2023]
MRFNFILFSLLPLLFSLSSAFLRRGAVDPRFANSLGRRSFSTHAHGTLLPRAATSDLEAAALGFIKLMQTIEGGKYKERQVLIVGGQAIQHYYPGYRETDDCDINIQAGSPPVKSMKEAIARNSNGKYEIGLRESNFALDNGVKISIDAVDSSLARDKPTGYKKASDINTAADLPYIPKPDLLTAKLVSCSERMDDDKAEKDAKDAFQIVANELKSKGVSLSAEQKDIIVKGGCMNRVYEVTKTCPSWWGKSLGIKELAPEE